MQIRSLTTDDLAPALVLLEIAGLAGAQANLARYLRLQPSCGWCATDADGRLVGLVTMLRQGAAGFVGAMAVAPAQRGAGLGRRLLEHAHAYAARVGITTLLLEATALGEHLYRKLGYVGEHETVIVTRESTSTAPLPKTRLDPHALPAIAQLDRAATGVERDDLIALLLAEHDAGAAITVGGELCAAGMIVCDRLGPLLARDAAAGRALADHLAPACRVATVPAPNEAALVALARHGFVEARRLRRMRKGPAVTMRVPWLWSLASPGAG